MKKLAAIAVCLLSLIAATLRAQENRNVRVENRASSAIRYLYASNVDRETWEEDLLGPLRIILPDHYMIFNIDDGSGHCLYDIKAVLSDGRTAVTRSFNVCTNSTWTVYDAR